MKPPPRRGRRSMSHDYPKSCSSSPGSITSVAKREGPHRLNSGIFDRRP